MVDLKDGPVAALLGDVVGSRVAADRGAVHRALVRALDDLNADLDPLGALRVTTGDEFQGVFASVGQALGAAWRLRWLLAGEVELRYGVGWGPVRVLDEETRIEDGPGWWVARDAVVHAEEQAARAATRHLRTAYRRAQGDAGAGGPDPGAVNAALLCRDHLVGSLSARSQRVLARMVAGASQAAIAEAEGISASAVSQRVRGDGLAVVVAAQELLEGLT